jgi:DNA-directed RNA polymerase specialized sigma24 family protein
MIAAAKAQAGAREPSVMENPKARPAGVTWETLSPGRRSGAFSCWMAAGQQASAVEEEIASLLPRVCEGDEEAWQALWRRLDPELDLMVHRRRFLGRLSHVEDERRGVVLQVMARLRHDGFRRIKMYQEEKRRNAALSFMAWLAVVTKHVAIDCVRAHPDYVAKGPRQGSKRPGGLAEPGTLPPGSRGPGVRPAVTILGTAGELLDYARRELPEQQRRAIELWVTGHAAADIATELQLSNAAEAERLVRAALERLRRQFRTSLGGLRP